MNQELESFIARYDPKIAATARTALAKMRSILPGAVEIVYDNYNGLVVGFGPTERTSDALFSIVLYPRWVTLFFLKGATLPDPDRLLKGSGKFARHFALKDAADLDRPDLRALMTRAIGNWDGAGAGRIVIKSVSAKQRPRRPK